jgi:hypothetical protein
MGSTELDPLRARQSGELSGQTRDTNRIDARGQVSPGDASGLIPRVERPAHSSQNDPRVILGRHHHLVRGILEAAWDGDEIRCHDHQRRVGHGTGGAPRLAARITEIE